MEAVLDMNSNRIINVPEPVDDFDLVRKVDIQPALDAADTINDIVADTSEARDEAVEAAADAEQAASDAVAATITKLDKAEALYAPWFGPVGNGVANDTAAFSTLETLVSGVEVDLGGKTYLVDGLPIGNTYINGFFLTSNAPSDPTQRGVTYVSDDAPGMISGLTTTGGIGSAYSGGANNTPTVPGRSTRNRRVILASQACLATFNISACIASIYSWAYGNVSVNIAARQSVAGCPQAFNAGSEEAQAYGFGATNLCTAFSIANGSRVGNLVTRNGRAAGSQSGNLFTETCQTGNGKNARLGNADGYVTVVGGVVTAIAITVAGTGYVPGVDTIEIVDRSSGGSGAAVSSFTVDGSGGIATITFTGGSGYSANTVAYVVSPVGTSGNIAGTSSTVSGSAQNSATLATSGATVTGSQSTAIASSGGVVVSGSTRAVALGASGGTVTGDGAAVIASSTSNAVHTGAVIIGSRRVQTAADRTLVWGGSSSGSASTANRKGQIVLETGAMSIASTLTQSAVFSDIAEYFENLTTGVIPLGTMVALEGRKVRPWVPGNRLHGVISATAGLVMGDSWNHWQGRYLYGDFGEPLMGDVWDEDAGAMVLGHLENPDYDPEYVNVPRSERPDEWSCVGLIGQVHVRVDRDYAPDEVITDGLRCMEMRSPFDANKGYGVAFCYLNARV